MLGELTFDFDRLEILERVKANRDKHAVEYEEAMEGWYLTMEDQLAAVIKEAREQAKLVKAQEDPTQAHFSASATRPQSHTDDYDRIIDMLALAKAEMIELDENEFSQYVRDEWQWKKAFTESANFYNQVKGKGQR